MFGFKIITAKELYYLKTIENCYAEKDEAWQSGDGSMIEPEKPWLSTV